MSYLITVACDQVLSDSVSKALMLTGGSEAFETAMFLAKVDKFFDCLNVTSYRKGFKTRKEFQKPYFKKDDARLKVYKHVLCDYISISL